MPIKKARLKISDYNEARKSNMRAQERKVTAVSLSLTSMVDMFAILVIFLLANNNSMTEWLQLNQDIQLPKARTTDIPNKSATIQISPQSIYGDSQLLMATKDLAAGTAAVQKWLGTIKEKEGYINLVAHEALDFGVVKKITAACQSRGFNKINFIVQPTKAN